MTNSNLNEKIKDTKDNGILIECNIIGAGTQENPYRPEIFDKYNGYYHYDTTLNAGNKCRIWVNKKKTKDTELSKIRNDATLTKIKETTGGKDNGN